MSWARSTYCLSVYVSLCSCAASAVGSRVSSDVARGDFSSALARYERDGRSSAVLRTFSESVLRYAARSSDPAERRAAFIELSMLGTRAGDLLEELSQSGESPSVRAQALQLRTQLGDDAARRELRSLIDHPDPEVADSAVQALSPTADAALLEAALRSPRPERRSTALALLSRAAPEHRAVLIEASRFDPSPQLRVAALHALERYGAEIADALDNATRDPDQQVRAAALSALARVAPARAEPVLDQQLGAAVSEASISAAITLLSMQPPRHAARARAAIAAALSSPDVALRARAASALQRLPASELDRAGVRARLREEHADTVRLALSLLLGPEDLAARRTLSELSATFTLPGAQAAAELAALSGSARARLCAFGAHESALVRTTAARLIARTLRDPEPIAKLLADPSWQVRGAAAGAVLNVL
jgi:HEAT repeat protein